MEKKVGHLWAYGRLWSLKVDFGPNWGNPGGHWPMVHEGGSELGKWDKGLSKGVVDPYQWSGWLVL